MVFAGELRANSKPLFSMPLSESGGKHTHCRSVFKTHTLPGSPDTIAIRFWNIFKGLATNLSDHRDVWKHGQRARFGRDRTEMRGMCSGV